MLRSVACCAAWISYMVEDPRTISSCLDLLFVAKSFERITPRLSPRSSHDGACGATSLSQREVTLL